MILFPRTALGTKHESRIWRAGLRPGAYTCFLWELPEEAHVVLEKDLNIVDAVLQHREAIDAYAEGKAADFFRVVIHEAVDGGIDHARAEEFNPRGALAFRARSAAGGRTCSAAKWAGDVELDGRLGEREIAWPEARFHAGTKKLFYEIFDGAREIAKRNVGVHGEAFDLVKGEGMRGVRIVAAIDLAGNDDAHGRLLLFHGANLHGRGVRAEKKRRLRAFRQVQIKGIHIVAHGMEFWNVQGFEIVVGCFDFGAFDDGEADGEKNVFNLLEDLADQVMRADRADDAGEGEVDFRRAPRRVLSFENLNSTLTLFNYLLDLLLVGIEEATNPPLLFGASRHQPIVLYSGEDAVLAANPPHSK